MRTFRVIFGLFVALCSFAAGARAQTVRCSSDDGHRHYCEADTRYGVTLTIQVSGAACQQNYSWGYDERGIWVDHGCRAEFALVVPRGEDNIIVRCSSDDERKHFCPADTRGDVEVLRQHSHADCIEGTSWGYGPDGIWVDHGCRAEFVVEPNERREHWERRDDPGQPVSCSSEDGRRHYCPVDTRGGVQMVNQHSESPCQEAYSWGFDVQGIWVDHGCRAEFLAHGGGGGREGPFVRECRRAVGEARAHELVEQCRRVTPGTHPPCNDQNSCRVITEEIRRSCELLGRDGPGFCENYR